MRSLFIVLLVALSCLALAKGQCPRTCRNINRPVCASWTRRGITDTCTFRNDCTLQNQICQRRQNWIKRLPEAACIVETRNCRSLLQ
ncbi:vasotab-like [Drosophila miranda]|uniref:vasotab-like n=1 Tax=Drosophila miranda TaxID=7229 RepID=UPI00143F1BC8|nr:vasotab-like [Drosophila miranda]